MKTHTFWLVRLLVMVCIFAVGSVPMVYADAHEAGEEMKQKKRHQVPPGGSERIQIVWEHRFGWVQAIPRVSSVDSPWILIFTSLERLVS